MSRARNTTTAPTGSIAPLGLRLMPELRLQIEGAARANGRSLNAEVTARLQTSFEVNPAALPPLVEQAVKGEMTARGGDKTAALIRLVLAAQAKGGTIFYAQLTSKTKFHEFLAMLDAGKTIIPPDASIQFEITPEN